MKFMSFLAFQASFLFVRNMEVEDLQDKTIIFISGFPQSGTSIMLQLFEQCTVASTMVTGCKTKGSPLLCMKKNFEGQWLAGSLSSNIHVKLFHYCNTLLQ
jgi:hypothetical protein